MADGGAEADGVGEGEGCGDAGREDGPPPERTSSRAPRESEKRREGAEAEVDVARALVACVLAEGVGVDGVAVCFEAVGERGVRPRLSARRRAPS